MKKSIRLTEFDMYLSSLERKSADILRSFFVSLQNKTDISEKQNSLLKKDFENAFLAYRDMGVPVEKAVKLLSPENLGDFYLCATDAWFPLDNAAKIYPMSMSTRWMAVFRMSFYLKEDVVPEILQMALNFTIKRFPYFAGTLKKGFFWHYIDGYHRRFEVMPESMRPCSPIDSSRPDSPTFRVIYYRNRISVEMFHAVADGTGGLCFLKAVTAEYLRLLGYEIPFTDGVLDINERPDESEWSNDFNMAESSDTVTSLAEKKSLQLKGRLVHKARPCRFFHFDMKSDALYDAAKRHNTTITVYMLTLMFIACAYATSKPKGRIHIQVPVNMRRFFPSKTVSNFSLYAVIREQKEAMPEFDELLEDIAVQLEKGTRREDLNSIMQWTKKLVRSIRFIPLVIKHPIVKVVYSAFCDNALTNTFSNIGNVKLPAGMQEKIEKMDFVLGTPVTNRAACTLCSCSGLSTFTITKLTADRAFEEKMHELLVKEGLEPVVSASEVFK